MKETIITLLASSFDTDHKVLYLVKEMVDKMVGYIPVLFLIDAFLLGCCIYLHWYFNRQIRRLKKRVKKIETPRPS